MRHSVPIRNYKYSLSSTIDYIDSEATDTVSSHGDVRSVFAPQTLCVHVVKHLCLNVASKLDV